MVVARGARIDSRNRGTMLGKGGTLENPLRRCTDSSSSLRTGSWRASASGSKTAPPTFVTPTDYQLRACSHKSRLVSSGWSLSVLPQKRTFVSVGGMSEKCHQRWIDDTRRGKQARGRPRPEIACWLRGAPYGDHSPSGVLPTFKTVYRAVRQHFSRRDS
jgi:hypothetical protein